MLKHLIILLFLFNACSFSSDQEDNNPEITAKEVIGHIEYLASDELEGRFTGSEGAEEAAEYIKDQFESAGLQPIFNKDYFQEFPFISGLKLTKNSLEFTTSEKTTEPELQKDYITAPFSGNADAAGNLVFAGYGITASDLKYDDYNGIDVKDKIVLVLRYHPESNNPHSEFENYAAFRQKANTAFEKGAKGIIFVNGFIPKNDEDKLIELHYDGAAGIKDLAAVQVKREVIDGLLSSLGYNLKDLQAAIDSTKNPNSFEIPGITVNLQTGIEEVKGTGINVGGILPGNDPVLKDEYIIIGAHYDHLGYGETGSLYRGADKLIHNGADDNASGTAGIIELAEKFAATKENKRSIIFYAFSGEELGLIGSSYIVNNPPVDLTKSAVMINLDMVGRLDSASSLIIYGTGTSKGWKALLEEKNKGYNFKLTFNDEGYGPSDQSSFYAKNIPVLFFFTGTHSDYHRPEDDFNRINSIGEEEILKYVYDIASETDKMESKPEYVNVPKKDSGKTMSFRVYVGTIPDYSGQTEGLKINGVSEGSPAQKAGLQGGDIIINFGGKKISNIYDYTYALGEFSPGDIVDVTVIRDNKEITLKVELGAR